MKNKNFTVHEICMMSLLSAVGIFTKPIVAPLFNLLTDFVQIPGGSVSAGFSMLFLVFAVSVTGKFGTAAMMGILQASIALIMGFTAQAGLLVYISYTLPGIAVDIVMTTKLFSIIPIKYRMMIAGAAGVLAGAIISNMLYFQLSFLPFFLFYTLGIFSGIVGGYIAYLISERLPSSILG